MPRIRVTVAVLGDLGRSPRMLYHARALADSIADVDLVGHREHELPADLAEHPHVRVHALPSPAGAGRHRLPRPLFLAVALWNVLRQAAALAAALVRRVRRPDVVLVQTPPALPTLVVALAAARARRARLVVDWHNLGWAMLGLRVGRGHPAVRLTRALERAAGRRADAHVAVSSALAAELDASGIGPAVVLRDRPGERFAPTPPEARRALLERLEPALGVPGLAADRSRALLVSPTSWTADEDMALLADAVLRYDGATDFMLPPLVVVVTGDGPLRAEYEARFARLRLARVALRTLWLSPADYPVFLGCADLGLCLHRSASGLDLPMKVADLFGAGVPVAALDYGPCLAELVRHEENGLLFRSSEELAACLVRVFAGWPRDAELLGRLRTAVAAERRPTWRETWEATAKPLFVAPGRR